MRCGRRALRPLHDNLRCFWAYIEVGAGALTELQHHVWQSRPVPEQNHRDSSASLGSLVMVGMTEGRASFRLDQQNRWLLDGW